MRTDLYICKRLPVVLFLCSNDPLSTPITLGFRSILSRVIDCFI